MTKKDLISKNTVRFVFVKFLIIFNKILLLLVHLARPVEQQVEGIPLCTLTPTAFAVLAWGSYKD